MSDALRKETWLEWLFLERDKYSDKGELEFQRWRILKTPWLSIFIHFIAKVDTTEHPHDHPWNFASMVLIGQYIQTVWSRKDNGTRYCRRPFQLHFHRANDFHKIEIVKPTWTIVFVGKRIRNFGYRTETGWLNSDLYHHARRKGIWWDNGHNIEQQEDGLDVGTTLR